MANCCEHHKVTTNGVGKCSKPMWSGMGLPAGFCDRPAYGKQIPGKAARWDPEALRKLDPYVPFLACPAHGGPESEEE